LPVSVFGWPGILSSMGKPATLSRADFDAFYPTSLLVTGFDILFFWVARMIMLGCWFSSEIPMPDGRSRALADSVPFREVYIHALVRDANREKMSKTKGNVIDPIEIVKQYGTDAVRFTLASMASPGTDIAFNVARTEGYRAFANKIWNAARFIFMNVDRAAEVGIAVDLKALGSMPTVAPDAPLEARWIIAELHAAATEVSRSLEAYRFDEAANAIYKFFWGNFCDWYIEIVKLRLDFDNPANKVSATAALTTLVLVFEAALRLLSPFMPFITEELWHAVYDGKSPAKSVAQGDYPVGESKYQMESGTEFSDQVALDFSDMSLLQAIITGIRARRKENGVEEKAITDIEVDPLGTGKKVVVANQIIIQRLAKVGELRLVNRIFSEGLLMYSHPDFDLGIKYERTIDVPAERERLTKDITKYEKGLAAAERQLGNEGFLAKAPAHVVEGLKKQEAETRLLLEKARAALNALPEQ
jgi:valyl-tRNA synthetase